VTIFVARLHTLPVGRFAVKAMLTESRRALHLVTATSPRTTLPPSLIDELGLPQIKTPTPIRGSARPLYLLAQGADIGEYRLPEALVAAHSAAGQFGVQGILGADWPVECFRVCINQRTLQLEMHVDP
jgi:hypothetical protein